jgi:hypothetical protein
MRTRELALAGPPPDPFRERERAAFCRHQRLLGAHFEFETDSSRLLRIVRQAFEGLPPHGRARPRDARFRLLLVETPDTRGTRGRHGLPPVRGFARAGLVCGAVGGAGFVALSPGQRSGMLVIDRQSLRDPYHIRYELLEFAVYVLAARGQGLVPLHAGCIGRRGRAVLLVGDSGCGKSTLVLQGVLAGLELVAEDSVLVDPRELLATGIASFVHLREDSVRFLTTSQRRRLFKKAAWIRRRSGVEKLEVDLRSADHRLAASPPHICAVVFLSGRAARDGELLLPLSSQEAVGRLTASQRYAAHQPGWSRFIGRVTRLPTYELRRGSHPGIAIDALSRLMRR